MFHSLHVYLFSVFHLTRVVRNRLRAFKFQLLGAKLGRKCLIGRGCRIDYPWTVSSGTRVTFEPDVWLKVVDAEASIQIGEYTFLGKGVEIDVLHCVNIGSHVLIGPDVFIVDHDHNIVKKNLIVEQGCSASGVQIGDDVWIGTGVTILPGVTIERGAVIGAGAVVTKNVSEYEIWAGIPAKKIGTRE